jgi:hypothetical protein
MLIFEKPAGFPNFWVVVPGQRPWCTATRGGTSSTALQYYSSCSILRAENKVKLARRLRTFLTPPLSLMTTTSSGELSRPCQHRRKLRANLFIATLSFASARRPHSVLAGGLSHMPLALFKLFFFKPGFFFMCIIPISVNDFVRYQYERVTHLFQNLPIWIHDRVSWPHN